MSNRALSPADFQWDEFFWKLKVHLPSWQGFQGRRGASVAQETSAPSDGIVDVVFAPEGRDASPLLSSELALVRWAIDHEREMQLSLLDALLLEYPSIKRTYAEYLDDPKLMPNVRDVAEFRSLIGLYALNVHQLERNGLPYVGFEFGCTWDNEHGLGVLMHGARVVEIGGADTANLLWIAKRDADANASAG